MNRLEQVREQCAVTAWNHYMDTCKRLNRAPASYEEFIASSAIRALPLPEDQTEALPEMNQRPMFWFSENKRDIVSHSHRQAYGNTKNVASEYSIPLYAAPVDFEALRKENEQLKYMVGLDKNDPIPEWEMIEPTFWKGANLTVIGDRHLPNGRRQHLVKETSGELREFGNADIFYSESVK